MIHFNEDGSTDIDFPAGTQIHVKAPTFGALKRLRAERVRFARVAQDKALAWDAEHPAPEGERGDGTEDQAEPDPMLVARHAEDRQLAVEEANVEGLASWWRLLLVGDDTFKGLAEGRVPENVDEWPAALLYDFRPIIPANASVEVILSAQSTPDRWMRHVGEGRSRSGSTNGAVPQMTSPLPQGP